MSETDILLQALTNNREIFGSILAGKVCIETPPTLRLQLEKMFSDHFGNSAKQEEIHLLALICTLYLSVVHAGFSKKLFRTAITFLREHTSIPTFNCTHYEKLYTHLSNEPHTDIMLFSDINNFCTLRLKREDIFDAFDFMTNAL